MSRRPGEAARRPPRSGSDAPDEGRARPGGPETGRTELLVRSAGPGEAAAPAGTPGGDGAEITAEIPLVRQGGQRPPVELADGTLWYPGVSKRLPAPFGLRLVVWLLLFVLVVAVAGLEVERVHPSWLAFLRRTGAAASAVAPAGKGQTAGSGGGSGTAAPKRLTLVTKGAKTSTYAVPAHTYQIVVSCANRCWTTVASPAGSSHYVLAKTLTPKDSPAAVTVTGTAAVTFAARATSLVVRSGKTTLGTIHAPEVSHAYLFKPAG